MKTCSSCYVCNHRRCTTAGCKCECASGYEEPERIKYAITVTIEGGPSHHRDALAREIAALLDSVNIERDELKRETQTPSSSRYHEEIVQDAARKSLVKIEIPRCSECDGEGYDMGIVDGASEIIICRKCAGSG